ncbi:uncharacterized protein Dyak_GE28094, isoform B [Drosophila yakuba]|uniref:Uncharacterized protein, isoform A n=1 Tax=Drosophila yakuba TaxID=7245 RepID=A0A0R1DWX6_DROYA|nr:uncharacterized protein Dyak_GE28094, isoform A [Drosophila yakuba]KRJ99620.1 uncharacterized protein Dyak_GE28094, isoform B [Drosophila yakuba]
MNRLYVVAIMLTMGPLSVYSAEEDDAINCVNEKIVPLQMHYAHPCVAFCLYSILRNVSNIGLPQISTLGYVPIQRAETYANSAKEYKSAFQKI